jgi:hypothetical protein
LLEKNNFLTNDGYILSHRITTGDIDIETIKSIYTTAQYLGRQE